MRQRSIGVDYAERVDAAPDGRLMTGPTYALVDARICITCGTWLSLGPSNDSPEAVQVEIEAARIARDPQTAPEHGRTGPDGCAACGWAVARFDGDTPPIANAAAGWLAWQIANHDTHADAESA